MSLRITPHAGHHAPPDAIDRLWSALGPRRGEVRFVKAGRAIKASMRVEEGNRIAREARYESDRQVLLELLDDVCRAATPALTLDWYAISPE
jgi:hypothetical protein